MCDQTDNSAPTNIDRLKTLQKALDFSADFDVAATDVAKLLSSAGSLEPSSQSMAVALSKSSRLHDWITCGISASLIVHGNKLSGRKRQRSALSLVCAKLIDELGLANVKVRGPEDSKIFTVSWFCGERTQYAPEGAVDNNANIVAMWRSLIAQLLHQVLDRTDLDPAGFGYIARIDTLLKVDDSVKESWLDNVWLGSLFIELVYTLPEGSTLFCILDGVSHHEDRKHHADLQVDPRLSSDQIYQWILPLQTTCYHSAGIESGRILVWSGGAHENMAPVEATPDRGYHSSRVGCEYWKGCHRLSRVV